MNSFLKNEDKLRFLSFIFNNQSLSFTIFDFLISKYNNYEKHILVNQSLLELNSFVFSISKEEIKIIEHQFILNKTNKFSKRDSIYSTNDFESYSIEEKFEFIKRNYDFLISNNDRYEIIFDSSKLKLFFKSELNDFSLEDPYSMSEKIRNNLKDIVKREYETNSANNTNLEKSFLKLLNLNSISIQNIDNIIIKNSIKNKFQIQKVFDDKNMDGIYNFIDNIYENVKKKLDTLSEVSESVSIRTKRILNNTNDIDIKEKRKYLNNYLKLTEETAIIFSTNTRKKETIYNYLRKLNILISNISNILEVDNTRFNNLFLNWNKVYNFFIQELKKLSNNISLVISELKLKKEELDFQEKLDLFFNEFEINEKYDSEIVKKGKKEKYFQWVCVDTDFEPIFESNLIWFDKKDVYEKRDNKLVEFIINHSNKEINEINNEDLIEIEKERKENENKELQIIKQKELERKEYLEKIDILSDFIYSRNKNLSISEVVIEIKKMFFSEEFEKKLLEKFEKDNHLILLSETNSIIGNRELFKIIEESFRKITK